MQFIKRLTLGLGGLFLLLVAGAVGAPQLYFMAGLLLALSCVSYVLGWVALRGLEFNRVLPGVAWEGEEGELIYAIHNRSPIFRFFLMIREPFPEWIETVDADPPLFNVEGRDTTRLAIPVRFLKRGVYRVESFEVTALDPLGVFAFTRHIPCEGEIVVYPMPQTIGQMPLIGRDRNGWQEFSATALRGNSVDPDGVRGYVPGDPLRRIHWRQTARTGSLSVIEFEEAQSVNLVIALDLIRGSEFGKGLDTTLEYAVRLAATIAQQAIQQGAGVRLLVPSRTDDTGIEELSNTFGRGQEHLYRIYDTLARVEATASMPLSDLITESVAFIPPGTTLMAMSANPSPQLVDALSRYTINGGEVGFVYVDPTTFSSNSSKTIGKSSDALLADLMAVHVQTFVLRCNDYRDVIPEMRNV